MEPKQSARELLERCKTLLENSGYHLDDPQADHGFFRTELKKTCDAIDAYLAAPNESAMEIVRMPMEMLTEIFNNAVDWVPFGDSERVDKIAAKYGVKVEG